MFFLIPGSAAASFLNQKWSQGAMSLPCACLTKLGDMLINRTYCQQNPRKASFVKIKLISINTWFFLLEQISHNLILWYIHLLVHSFLSQELYKVYEMQWVYKCLIGLPVILKEQILFFHSIDINGSCLRKKDNQAQGNSELKNTVKEPLQK